MEHPQGSKRQKNCLVMLLLFILGSMIVPDADALEPGHILHNEWTMNEKFHYVWLWMSW